jgi:hypothetical protein
MNSQKSTNFIIFIVIIIAIIGSFYLWATRDASQVNTSPLQTEVSYTNNQYGFDVALPTSWKGYSAVTSNWEGNLINTLNQTTRGPEILIRHPLWSPLNPRQDIPVMIFTLDQWDLIQQEKLSIGAAPIGPSELGRNGNYVFALPARYNFSFLTGFEEVQKIIDDKSFHAF